MKTMVLGAGVSGLAAARLLLAKTQDQVTLIDQKVPSLPPSLLGQPKVKMKLDSQLGESDWAQVHQFILSSGIKLDHPLVVEAHKRGVALVSEADLAFRYFEGTAIGITGTNGKSTVTKLIAHILTKRGIDAIPCGNYGLALCDAVLASHRQQVLCVELSSFQLAQAAALRLQLGVFVNFAPDHEQWHGDTKEYFLAKWRLVSFLEGTQACLVTSSAVMTLAQDYQCQLAKDLSNQVLIFCDPLDTPLPMPSSCLANTRSQAIPWNLAGIHSSLGPAPAHYWQNLPIVGRHNLFDLSLALTAVEQFMHRLKRDGQRSYCPDDYQDFSPLPHRYQWIRSLGSLHFIDDSKATNVDAVLAALESSTRPVFLLLGGQSKGESFLPILRHQAIIKGILSFGESGLKIRSEIDGKIPFWTAATLSHAMQALPAILTNLIPKEGLQDMDVLLSPGGASFDEFKNYSERGDFFTAQVRNMDQFLKA